MPAGVTVTVVPGAHTRQASVHAGLDALGTSATPPAVVLVHDAARPAMPVSVFDAVADAVRAGNPAVVPVIAVVDTIKLADAHGGLTTVPRADLRATQTPQGFDRAVLERAHRHAAHSAERGEATDDAGLVEAIGVAVVAVPGHEDGAKITTARDLAIAQALLAGSWHEPPSAGGTTQERS